MKLNIVNIRLREIKTKNGYLKVDGIYWPK